MVGGAPPRPPSSMLKSAPPSKWKIYCKYYHDRTPCKPNTTLKKGVWGANVDKTNRIIKVQSCFYLQYFFHPPSGIKRTSPDEKASGLFRVCYVVVCCVVLCCVVLCCVVMCCVVMCCVVLCCVVLCCAVLCCDALCCDVLRCVVFCCVVLCGVVLC